MHNVDIRNISIGQIQYFIAVAKLNSFTKAAQQFHLTQSAISKKIASLEQQLDMPLFIRGNKNIALTPAGKYLYDEWKVFADQVEFRIKNAHTIQEGYQHNLIIAGLSSFKPELIMTPVLQNFHKNHPLIHTISENSTESEIFSLLLNDEVDVIFTIRYAFRQQPYDNVAWKLLGECPHEVCMLKSNPLSKKTSLELKDLARSTFIGLSPHIVPSYMEELNKIFKKEGFTPNISCYVNSSSSLTLNLNTDSDIFICDKYYRDHGSPQLCSVPLNDTTSGFIMAWKKDNAKKGLADFINNTIDLFENSKMELNHENN